jgi:hypothetical protein
VGGLFAVEKLLNVIPEIRNPLQSKGTTMTVETESTVTRIRRELFASGQEYYESRAPYATGGGKEDPTARSALVAAGTLTHTVAGILRMVAEDHGEEYAAKIVAFVVEAGDDGEVAFDANDDLDVAADQ